MKKKFSIPAFIVTAIVLTALMPQNGVFKYTFRQGDVWTYPSLSAPFDFPVLKTPKEYRQDLEAVHRNYIPIYKTDSTAYGRAMAYVNSDFPEETGIDSMFRSELALLLDTLYRTGIIGAAEEAAQADTTYVRVIDGNAVHTARRSDLLTDREARKRLTARPEFSGLPGHADPNRYVLPNLQYDRELNDIDLKKQLDRLSASKGFVSKGTPLVSEGQMVDEHVYTVLDSYRTAYLNKGGRFNNWQAIGGNFLYVSIILALSYIFLFYFREEFSRKTGNVLFLLFIYIMMMGLTRLVIDTGFLSVYIIPYALVPFFIVTFYDLRMSIFEYVAVLMLCAVITPFPFEMFFVNLFSGLAGVLVSRSFYLRGRLIRAAGVILLTYALSYVAISAMQENSLRDIRWGTLVWFVANAGLLFTLYQLIYLFEKLFGFVTNITLFELSDTNQPLLRELAEKAPGTFQHSLQVANLAEAAAKEIGANPLYARTGALYHDIGKTCNPLFFIENQSGNYNPHKELDPRESAEIIRKHVTDGVQLARKHNLPSVLIDFISSHHGNSRIYYFYHNYLKEHGPEGLDEADFRYPGPLPVSKETTICMMADAVEAASRSLTGYSEAEIQTLIDKIVNIQIEEGQFAESQLSFREIMTIKKVFCQKISGIHHTRISYPDRA